MSTALLRVLVIAPDILATALISVAHPIKRVLATDLARGCTVAASIGTTSEVLASVAACLEACLLAW
tara:strand:- start:378 stop:578 length:201 start_codon:yes stop_codon:yes gene_type:complete